ncbi:MAG: energy transducer TonB [Candidatus Velthaea sp.]|jgi:outer membrane biosynthesis protein TonB
MKRLRLWKTAAACAFLSAVALLTPRASDAQTWRWTYVTQNANGPPFVAQSTVAIDAQSVHMTYSIPLQKRQVVIESCVAALQDVIDATTVRNAGTTYFLIRFKPSHGAACGSGRRPAVALPADDDNYVRNVATEVGRQLHTAGAKPQPSADVVARAATAAPTAKPTPAATAKPNLAPTAKPTPEPTETAPATVKPTAEPTLTPSPSPSPARAAVQDWVENDGLFWFIRIRNLSRGPLRPAGEVFDCRNVETGCGPFMHTELEPGGTATVAVIAAATRSEAPAFEYRYTISDGGLDIAGSGASTKLPPRQSVRMTAKDLRSAQELALSQLRSPRDTPAPILPARLIKRGSSRLAIGETGTAVVRVTIADDGTPQEVSIVSITNKALTAAAIETAVSSTYVPATQNGRAVAAKYIATFSFDGQDPALSSVPVWKRPPSPTPEASPSPTPSLTDPSPGAPTSSGPSSSASSPQL